MQFMKEHQKAAPLLHCIQNISELNGKDKTDLKEFRLAQSKGEAVVPRKRKAFASYPIAK